MSEENPYQNPYDAPASQNYVDPKHGGGALVPQVRIVAILMMIQGVLEILMGIYFVVLGVVMPQMLASNMANQPNQPPPDQVEMISNITVGVFLAGGAIVLLIGVLRLVAGIRGVTYRGRMLGLFTHFAGFLVIATCYCFPTALAVGIYGLVVYFNADVALAFRLRKDGLSSEEVLAHFGR